MARITWEGDTPSMTGYILGEAKGYKAKIRAFEIKRSPFREDSATPYLLAHRLPFRGIERKFGSLKLAQEHAERYLVWAMELMGFKPAAPYNEDRLAQLINEYTGSMPKDEVHFWAEEIVKELRK